MGAHLSGDHSKACSIIDEYIKTLTGDNAPEKNPFEYSELLLYKNFVIEESGNTQEALDNLEKIEASVVDKFAWKEKKGLCSFRMLFILYRRVVAQVESTQ